MRARPEGLEIYLDAVDISRDDWLPGLLRLFAGFGLPGETALLVEGPVRALDGNFFDLSENSPGNRTTIDRLVEFGAAVGAKAACVHLIAPTSDLSAPRPGARDRALDRCLPLASYYTARCRDGGMVATVENVPPVGRMREGRMMTSPVGCAPEDLRDLAALVPGLRFTVDTSHAQLFLNAADGHNGGYDDLVGLIGWMAESSSARTPDEFLSALRGQVETAHVSDADGLLGEGLGYGQGRAPLDRWVDGLLGEASWIVAEILEPDPNHSPAMREAALRIADRRAQQGVPT